MHLRLILFLAAVGISISQVTPHSAAGPVSFSFVTIAIAKAPIGFSLPAINNNGTVAFADSTGNFLYVGSGGAVTTLYQSGEDGLVGFGGHPDINDLGTVSFLANRGAGSEVLTGDGGALTVIAPPGGYNNVSINASGTVAVAEVNGDVFTGNGGPVTTIATTSGPLANFSDEATINDSGVVAFHATLDAGGGGIFRGDGSVLETIADSSGPLLFDGTFGRHVVINNAGVVAFHGALDAGGFGVFTSAGPGLLDTVVTSPGVSPSDDQSISINNNGELAFRLGGTLFTTVGGSLQTVPLSPFGLEGFGWNGINDAGQIVFSAFLQDGRFAIIRADPIRTPDNRPPDCSPVRPSQQELWPPDHQLVEVRMAGATDPDGDVVTLSITAVTQDEPVNGAGDGNTAPDAGFPFGLSPDRVQLRRERVGGGDGRVYRIAFTGDDRNGGICSGVALVGMPHSRNRPAIDSGGAFNSFNPFP